MLSVDDSYLIYGKLSFGAKINFVDIIRSNSGVVSGVNKLKFELLLLNTFDLKDVEFKFDEFSFKLLFKPISSFFYN